jgi:hypothetical protein
MILEMQFAFRARHMVAAINFFKNAAASWTQFCVSGEKVSGDG